MNLILIDADKIKEWMKSIETYDYDKLATQEQRERMAVILNARYEAYQNVLQLAV
jgi:hypothetical protein